MPRKISRETRRTSSEQLSRRNKRKNVFNPKTVEYDDSSFSASAKKFKAQEELYKKLLERCVGGFTQNNNESYNQLIWKITPKIIPAGSKIVEIAANIAAGVFNEGKTSLLYYMSSMGLSLGPNAHSFVSKEDAERISISDARAQGSTRERRMARRQQQLNILEANDEAEGSSYGAGIDDTIVGGQNFSETAKPIGLKFSHDLLRYIFQIIWTRDILATAKHFFLEVSPQIIYRS
ncbi:hypothetical protein M0804_014971 [Polistes exclamans]|nr:hypothetical protein M0804_014971 [Polistes exclamans]